jgi:hypothetical protein
VKTSHIISSPLAKGDPVLGISGLDPRVLAFSITIPNTPPLKSPGDKKKVGGGGNPPKKGTSTAFCAGPLTPKKKAGVEQEKVGRVICGSSSEGPSDAIPQKTSPDLRPGALPFASCFFIGFISDLGQ